MCVEGESCRCGQLDELETPGLSIKKRGHTCSLHANAFTLQQHLRAKSKAVIMKVSTFFLSSSSLAQEVYADECVGCQTSISSTFLCYLPKHRGTILGFVTEVVVIFMIKRADYDS